MDEQFYDDEEKELIESIDSGNWQTVGNLEQWKTLLSTAARNTPILSRKKEKVSLARETFLSCP
jgi:hypothetical protein